MTNYIASLGRLFRFMAFQSDKWYNGDPQHKGPAALMTPWTSHKGVISVDLNLTTTPFYVYVLARPDGAPFYVGKGTRNRMYAHDYEARSGHKCHKCSIIRKIWREGGKVQRYTVLVTPDEVEALAYEVELIALYGRDTLANLTDGGEGATGRVDLVATRAKRSVAMKAKHASQGVSQETREKMSLAQKARYEQGYRVPQSVRDKISASLKARHQDGVSVSEETRAKRSASLRARYADGWKMPDESRAKSVAGAKKYYENPELKAQRDAVLKASKQTPQYRAKIQARITAHWSDPEKREHMMTGIRAYHASPEARERRDWLRVDPEYRAKLSASASAAWAKRKQKKIDG